LPHFKCAACKIRLYNAVGPTDLVGDLCPGCGSLFEPVGELAEIVGFRALKHRDQAADDGPPGTHQRIAGRVDDVFARREALRAQARLDVGPWLDDGGSFSPEAVAKALALPTPGKDP
jgi:Zn-finger nucleic acid-binding protein